MIEQMKQIVKDDKFCVLATSSDNKPYCSLMAYAPSNDCSRIYMVTRKDSVKFGNLLKNSSVSLLIDTRKNSRDGINNKTKALTVTARFCEIRDESEHEKAKNMLLEKHPDLNIFLDDPEACIFAVDISSFLLLTGFSDSCYAEL